jgi:DNA-binding transcriptional regulator YiaG
MDSMEQRTEPIATADKPFHFVDSGLPNVYLVGIRYFTYPDGRVIPNILAIKKLMQLIAHDLIVQEEALTGDEIRFLRKRLGQKQTDFARVIGIEPETLSRCENGHQKLSESNDKFIRFYYALSALDDSNLSETREKLQQMLHEWREKQFASEKRPLIVKVIDDGWKRQVA